MKLISVGAGHVYCIAIYEAGCYDLPTLVFEYCKKKSISYNFHCQAKHDHQQMFSVRSLNIMRYMFKLIFQR